MQDIECRKKDLRQVVGTVRARLAATGLPAAPAQPAPFRPGVIQLAVSRFEVHDIVIAVPEPATAAGRWIVHMHPELKIRQRSVVPATFNSHAFVLCHIILKQPFEGQPNSFLLGVVPVDL